MMDDGLEDEVRRLLNMGYGWDLPAMSALGYSQFRPYFDNQVSFNEVVTEIKRATRRFIRRQYNWFRLNDPNIHWFTASDNRSAETIEIVVREWLSSSQASATRKGGLPRQEPVVE
jgi:tRNA dimethylallyltransferase